MVTAVAPWSGVDHAPQSDGAMSLTALNSFLLDMDEQPTWRVRADMEADYYDGNQYTAQDLRAMEARGIPPIVVNLTAPAINMVLGLETKTRTDFVLKPEHPSGKFSDLATALTVKVKEAERRSGADQATSDAHAAQVKSGLGWIHCGYNWMNPFDYWMVAEYVHRREIWWDWHDVDPWLRKARYLVRRKWYDEDVLVGVFPQYKDLIYHSVRDWAHFDPGVYEASVPLYMDQTVERDWSWRDEEWKNVHRRRLCLYEVWYRTYNRGVIMRTRDDRVIEYMRGNRLHDEAVARGVVQLEPALIPKVRLSWWMGPHRLHDQPTPYPHQYFPYVPFWGYREDLTGVPYGMIRGMKPLQDEVNARRARMLWQLSARRVIADGDAVLDHKAAAEEVARADMYLKLNENRKNKRPDAFRFEKDENLSAQQYQVYEDSKKTLQDAAGIYLEQLGKAGAAESGVAISQLIETGTTTLSEIIDNKKTARMLLGEIMVALVRKRMEGRQDAVSIETGGNKKVVHINRPRFDAEKQETVLENDLSQLMCSVGLDEVAQTPTARQQMYQQMVEMLKGLPENLQAAVIDLVVKASDFPFKDEMADRLRKSLGIQNDDPENMTPEEKQAYEQMIADNEQVKELTKRLQAAEVELTEAQAEKQRAAAELDEVRADQIRVQSNLNPELQSGSPAMPDQSEDVENSRAMRMIRQAEKASQEQVPGADPLKLERARRGAAPQQEQQRGRETAGQSNPGAAIRRP